MRFAGQRFRGETGAIGKFREGNFRAETGRSPYANPTGVAAMTNMPEVNASNFTKTTQRDMSNPAFGAPGKTQEPEFRAPSRI